MTNQNFNAETDSFGDNQFHKLDHMIGNRTQGQAVVISNVSRALPVFIVADRYPTEVAVDLGPLNSTSVAYEASRIVKPASGIVYGLSGYNSKGSAQWIQIHDAAALPANGAIPKVIITVPTISNFSILFGPQGRRFFNGIVVVNSSTGPTLTIGSADVWFDVQYV